MACCVHRLDGELIEEEHRMQQVMCRFFGAARGEADSNFPDAPFRDAADCCDFMDTHLEETGVVLMFLLPDVDIIMEVDRNDGARFKWDGKNLVSKLAHSFLPMALGKMMLPNDYYHGYQNFRVTLLGSVSQTLLPVETKVNLKELPSSKAFEFVYDGKLVAR